VSDAGARPPLLERPRAPLAVIALGVALALPSLALGFFADDWFMVAALRRRWTTAPAWWDLYHFVPSTDAGVRDEVARGVLPWWTAPPLRLHLVRPLTSALLSLDERLFGDASALWHAHALLWWVALLFVVAALFRRLLPRATATLALLVFVLIPAQSQAYAWLSSRHMLVAAVPSLGGLLAHLRWKEDGWRPGRWLAPLGLAVGLAASEAASGAVAFVLAYELFGPRARRLPWGARLRGAAPVVVLVALYLVVYRLAGGEMAANDAYVAPLGDPLRFGEAVAVRLPMLLGNALAGIPCELALSAPVAIFVALGIAASALVAWLFACARHEVDPRERDAVRWLVPGAVLATAGTCGGLPGGRALLIANVGFVVLLAVVLRHGLASSAARAERGRRGATRGLAFVHLALAPVGLLGGAAVMIGMARQTLAVADHLRADTSGARRVFTLAASDPMVNVYATAALVARGKGGLECLARLTGVHADVRVTRTGASSLSLEPVGRPLLTGPFEALYRARALPVGEGDVVTTCGASVRVARVEGGLPTRIDVDLGADLDDPALALVAWDGERLARETFARGETRVLPWRAGPMGTQ
jgi:hypothetical protein